MSDDLEKVLRYAHEEAMRTGSYTIEPDHLALGIVREGRNDALGLVREFGADPLEMKHFVESVIFRGKAVPFEEGDSLTCSPACRSVLETAMAEANRLSGGIICPVHLLLSLLKCEACVTRGFLQAYGADYSKVLETVESCCRDASVADSGAGADSSPATAGAMFIVLRTLSQSCSREDDGLCPHS